MAVVGNVRFSSPGVCAAIAAFFPVTHEGLSTIHSFFFIRTSNFDAEAERSYIFWRFEAETFLKMFLNLPGIVFQPISADVTRQTIKEHFLLRYGIKLLAHTGLTCSDATCEMSRQWCRSHFGTIMNRNY